MKTCAVKSYVRRVPDRPDPFDTPAHRDLVSDEEIIGRMCERAIEEAMRDPAFMAGMGMVP